MEQKQWKLTGLAIVWANTILYGFYACLFLETMFVITRKKNSRTNQARIFWWWTVIVFMLATVHLAINCYRVLNSYTFVNGDSLECPTAYFFELYSWDNIAHSVIEITVTWMGDCLIIYRCYIVWDRNWKVVVVPISLLLASMLTCGIIIYRSLHLPGQNIFDNYLVSWVSTLYATFLVQNVLTTGLLVYRIMTQHRRSRASTSGSMLAFKQAKVGPMGILRIIVESAAIYAIQTLLLSIMYATGNSAQYIFEAGMQVPIVGIVFTLMTVRLAMIRSDALLPTTSQVNGLGVVCPDTASDIDPATTGRDLSVVASGLGCDEAANEDVPEEVGGPDLWEKGILGLGLCTSESGAGLALEHAN